MPACVCLERTVTGTGRKPEYLQGRVCQGLQSLAGDVPAKDQARMEVRQEPNEYTFPVSVPAP